MTTWIFEKHIRDRESAIIALTGDVMIGRLVNDFITDKKPGYIWGDMLPLLQETDLNIINLEAALTKSKTKVAKVFNFKADPEKVSTLKAARIDLVNLANNHSLDYSTEGLQETLKTLDQEKINHIGAGPNLKEAQKPFTTTIKGIKIGVIGFTDNEPTWEATNTKPGTNYIPINDTGFEEIKKQIETLRPHVDVLIATAHWGPNMRERPTDQFQTFAHKLCNSGVDIFHGHSAHIFQGVQVKNNKLIMYDTGDFVDDYYVDPILRNDRSFIFLVEVNKEGFQTFRLIPILISNFQANLAKDADRDETLKRMQALSFELNTETYIEDGGLVPKEL